MGRAKNGGEADTKDGPAWTSSLKSTNLQSFSDHFLRMLESVDEAMETLTPCLSCATLISDRECERDSGTVTIMLPNQVEKLTVQLEDVAAFTHKYATVEITTTHLLIYLFSLHLDPSITCINSLRLLHMGKLYSVQKVADLRRPHPLLTSVTQQFSTFQLFFSLNHVAPPLMVTLEFMVTRSDPRMPVDDDNAVTYADAMIRVIKKALRRKLSVTSIEMARPSRISLNDSTTDVECEPRMKFRNTWMKVFRKGSLTDTVNGTVH